MVNASEVLLFSGSSHPELGREIAECLGISLGKVEIEKFPDGEISVQIKENVRGREVFVLQTIALQPNEYLMELLILVDALKRASAEKIVAVLPYYGYCRQDRKDKPRVPITAKLVANMLVVAGVTRVLTLDLHAGQLQGFFDIPVDNLYAQTLMVEALKSDKSLNLSDRSRWVVVVPDIGSVKLGRAYADSLGLNMAMIHKNRLSSEQVETVSLIGDVEGKDVLLADDICSTAGTLVSAAKACQKKGARRVIAVITHAILVSRALESLKNSPLELIYVSNTVPIAKDRGLSSQFKAVSVASLLASAIQRIISKESLSSLFKCES